MGYLRRAGRGRLLDGRLVIWSVAEGRRGRRWRWTLQTGEGTLEHVGLIELDGSGRFGRLELETSGGMLTLHPAEAAGTAHGNVVRPHGVEPINVPWSADPGVRVVRDPFASALLRASGWQVEIAPDLSLAVGQPTGDGDDPDLDDRGVPRLIDAEEWALEV